MHRAESRTTALWGGSGSIGFLYAPTPGISYGFVYRGIGRTVQYTFYDTSEALEYGKPRQSIMIGTTFWFPALSGNPYLNISLAAEKIIGVPVGQGLKFGLFRFSQYGAESSPGQPHIVEL
jgi:hypothetical protein